MTNIQLFQSTVGTDPQLCVNNQTGKYYYHKVGKCAVLVDRNVMFITSEIMDSDTRVSLALPAHPSFYLYCVSPSGSTVELVGKNEDLSLTVKKNFQIQAVCPL